MNARRGRAAVICLAVVAVATLIAAGCNRREPVNSEATLARLRSVRRLVDASHFDDARTEYERILAVDPGCAPAHVEFGYFLLEDEPVSEYGRAIERFECALRIDPADPFAVCGLGIAFEELGELDRAEPLLRFALGSERVKQAPGRTMVATAALGRIAATLGRTDEALACFAAAARSQAATPRARAIYLTSHAELFASSGRATEARTELREAIALDPENLRAHHQLARLLTECGESDEMRKEAEKEAQIAEILRQLVDHTARRFRVDHERTVRLRRELVAAWPEYAQGRPSLAKAIELAARARSCTTPTR